jgi:hypothetical protein
VVLIYTLSEVAGYVFHLYQRVISTGKLVDINVV